MATRENKAHTHNPFLNYLTRIHGDIKLIITTFPALITHPHNTNIHMHIQIHTHTRQKLIGEHKGNQINKTANLLRI